MSRRTAIVGPSNFSALYDHMRLTVARSPLFVFAADDVDSVCAVHILTVRFHLQDLLCAVVIKLYHVSPETISNYAFFSVLFYYLTFCSLFRKYFGQIA